MDRSTTTPSKDLEHLPPALRCEISGGKFIIHKTRIDRGASEFVLNYIFTISQVFYYLL